MRCALMRCALRRAFSSSSSALMRCTLRRAFSSSSSQVVPQLHEISCAQLPKTPATILAALLVEAGFKSFEVATPVPSYSQPPGKVLPSLRYALPEVGSADVEGHVDVRGFSIELPFGSANVAADEEVSHVLSVVEAAQKRSIPTRVTLLDALTLDDPAHVQRMASEIAHAGAEVIVLAGAEGDADCEYLESIYAEVLASNVAGRPMAQRVGIRARCGPDGIGIYARALDMCVQHLDTCLLDGPTMAPNPIALVSLLKERRLNSGINAGCLKYGVRTHDFEDEPSEERVRQCLQVSSAPGGAV